VAEAQLHSFLTLALEGGECPTVETQVRYPSNIRLVAPKVALNSSKRNISLPLVGI